MALSSVSLGNVVVNQSIIKNVRDQVVNELKDLSGSIKDETGKFIDKKIFENCNRTDNIKIIVNGDNISSIEALVHKITEMVYKELIENLEIVAKPRIDNYGTELDTLISTLDVIAATATATGVTPVTGATLGTLLTTLSVALKVTQGNRTTLKATEDSIGTQVK